MVRFLAEAMLLAEKGRLCPDLCQCGRKGVFLSLFRGRNAIRIRAGPGTVLRHKWHGQGEQLEILFRFSHEDGLRHR